MRHLAEGTLRRMVEEPLAVAARDRDHYASCASCQSNYQEIALDAREVAQALSLPEVQLDPAIVLRQVRERIVSEHLRPGGSWKTRLAIAVHNRRLIRPLSGAVAAVALVGALALTPAGSLAQSFITVFETKHVAIIPVTIADIRSLPDLANFGTVNAPRNIHPVTEPDAAGASVASHMQVVTPSSLPDGVPSTVQYEVVPGATGTFTFSAAKAGSYATAHGSPLPPMPARLDGSTLQLSTGDGVIAVFGSGQNSIPALVVGQMRAPKVSSTGVSVKEIEDYVLSLPGVSPSLAKALKSIGDPTSTLPLPIPIDLAQAHTVTVQGVQGTAVGDSTGVGSAVIWEKNGIIYGVGGALSEDQVLSVANGLH